MAVPNIKDSIKENVKMESSNYSTIGGISGYVSLLKNALYERERVRLLYNEEKIRCSP